MSIRLNNYNIEIVSLKWLEKRHTELAERRTLSKTFKDLLWTLFIIISKAILIILVEDIPLF